MMKRKMVRVSVWLVLVMVLVALAPLAVSADTWYTVRPGDTLYSIGRKFGLNAYSIAAYNNLANPNLIWPGQRLRICGGGGGFPAPVAPPKPAPVVQHGGPGGFQPVQHGPPGGQWVMVSHTQYGRGPTNWAPLQQQAVWVPHNAALQPIISRLWGGQYPQGGWDRH